MGLYGVQTDHSDLQDIKDEFLKEYNIITECVERRFLSESEENEISQKVDKFLKDGKEFINKNKNESLNRIEYSKGYSLVSIGLAITTIMTGVVGITTGTMSILVMIKAILVLITGKGPIGKDNTNIDKQKLETFKKNLLKSKDKIKDKESKKKVEEILKILERETK